MTFQIALAIVAIVSPLAGVCLGVYLARRASSRSTRDELGRSALSFLREADATRLVVLNFVERARRSPPSFADYRELVDAMIVPGTPESIRRLHHRKCGTATQDELREIEKGRAP